MSATIKSKETENSLTEEKLLFTDKKILNITYS